MPLLQKNTVFDSNSPDPKIGYGSDCRPDTHTEKDQPALANREAVMANEDNRERLKH
jgi:hypothetical protein